MKGDKGVEPVKEKADSFLLGHYWQANRSVFYLFNRVVCNGSNMGDAAYIVPEGLTCKVCIKIPTIMLCRLFYPDQICIF